MGDRKVTNKYIPPDFDPALIPRGKKLSSKDGTVPVRMMLPFSLQCATCQSFMYRGRKFNSKKEPMGGPDGTYLGITRFRFYIKCTHCSRPITFLTDPQNADYTMESGGTRNYEVYKDKDKTEQAQIEERALEEKLDPMKALENRVLESQREMADLDNLEQIKAMNARHLTAANMEAVLSRNDPTKEGEEKDDVLGQGAASTLNEEDEALIKSIQFGKSVKRLSEEDEQREEEKRQQQVAAIMKRQQQSKEAQQFSSSQSKNFTTTIPKFTVKRKQRESETQKSSKEARPEPKNYEAASSPPFDESNKGVLLSSLLGGYGSDSD